MPEGWPGSFIISRPVPDKRSEGTKGLEAQAFIESDGAPVEVSDGQRDFAVTVARGFAKGVAEQERTKSMRLEFGGDRDLWDVCRLAPDTGERHQACEFPRRRMYGDQRGAWDLLAAAAKFDNILDQPRGPGLARILVVNRGVDVASVSAADELDGLRIVLLLPRLEEEFAGTQGPGKGRRPGNATVGSVQIDEHESPDVAAETVAAEARFEGFGAEVWELGLDAPHAGPRHQRLQNVVEQPADIGGPDGGLRHVAVSDQALVALADVEAVAFHGLAVHQGVAVQAPVGQTGCDHTRGRRVVPTQMFAPRVSLGLKQRGKIVGVQPANVDNLERQDPLLGALEFWKALTMRV